MANNFNAEDLTNIDPSLQPLAEAIAAILSLPDESLTAETLSSIQGMVAGSITEKQHAEAVKNMRKGFVELHYGHAKAKETVDIAEEHLKQLIETLETTPEKKIILNTLFTKIYDIFDDALEGYYGETIDVPMVLNEGAKLPAYAHETDAAADLYAIETVVVKAHSLSNKIYTGVRMALPDGWMAAILPRSSIGANTPLRLSNSVGIIDNDYRGEIIVLYDNISDSDYTINAGDRIAQMLVMPSYKLHPTQVDDLLITERGEGGLGSSGK